MSVRLSRTTARMHGSRQRRSRCPQLVGYLSVPQKSMTKFTLAGVARPARNAHEFRSSSVSPQMERVLIAFVGHSALNPAVGGHELS
ncbi:hypothetical protein V8E36_003052 [Tilletia maclaganii]